ncbi:hypothetical protein [Candidatus Solirubrobacter pratensis]|uniref:hypothetical protein n=1 Tax=Candidatus Solirubrobacter pratensis TaxID=1298857 RepID=UPI000417A238|nr:hypothetical protein [Candidatus Solirubrobacter pratensis]
MTWDDPAMYAIAREITDEVLPPITLEIGRRYVHPEQGEIEITSGCYRDPTYDRISNWWTWTVVATGEKRAGYGSNWPVA